MPKTELSVTKWSDIAEEVGEQAGYREALVAVFKAHEGEETDERTTQDHVVKVTSASFARHFGISKQLFDTWVKSFDFEARRRRDDRHESATTVLATRTMTDSRERTVTMPTTTMTNLI